MSGGNASCTWSTMLCLENLVSAVCKLVYFCSRRIYIFSSFWI